MGEKSLYFIAGALLVGLVVRQPALVILACLLLLGGGVAALWGRWSLERVDYLRERKDVIYENLRDLNFEYQAGKYPEQDYVEQRAGLEDEAARVIAEMETLEARGVFGRRSRV